MSDPSVGDYKGGPYVPFDRRKVVQSDSLVGEVTDRFGAAEAQRRHFGSTDSSHAEDAYAELMAPSIPRP